MSYTQRNRIFPYQAQRVKSDIANLPQFVWEERKSIFEQLEQRGVANDVRVTVIGQPGDVKKQQEVVVLMMEHTAGGNAIPSGVQKSE
jgi:hypothetical protein